MGSNRKRAIPALLCVGAMVSLELRAQDPVEVSPDIYKVIYENANIRVMELTYEPGEGDDWHSHPAYIVHVIDAGRVRVFDEDGDSAERLVELGPPRHAEPVARHRMENIGDTTVRLLAIELKQ